jgi:O-antigen/teichoic acid export membrane protein
MLTGSVWGLIQNASMMAVNLVSVPLTIGYLGVERYGLWTLAMSLITFARFLDVGLTPSLTNLMAAANASGSSQELRRLTSGAICIAVAGCGAVAAASCLVPMFDWASVCNVANPLARREVPGFLQAVLLTSGMATALAGIDNVYISRLEVATPRKYGAAFALASLGALYVGTRLRCGLPALAFLVLGTRGAYRLVLLWKLATERPRAHLDFRVLPALVRELLPVSFMFMCVQVSETLLSSVPYLILSRTSGLSEVARFGVLSRFCSVPLNILSAVLPACWVVFTVAWERRDYIWLRTRLFWNCGLTVLVCACYTLFLATYGETVLRIWTQGKVQAEPILLIALGGWLCISAVVYWLNTFLHSITDLRFEVFCNLASIVFVAVLCILLAARWGTLGAAIATALGICIGSFAPMAMRVRWRLVSQGR